MQTRLLIFALLLSVVSCKQSTVRSGLDSVADFHDLFRNKRVGIVTNHTAYNSAHQHIVQVFMAMKDVEITALFGPEHGIRGQAEAGEKVSSENDTLKGIPIYSLYGEIQKPTADMLKNIDILVFDIQDIGTRYYTHIYTMALSMEAAAEHDIPFVVLDRPNPLNGIAVEGNILDPKFSSFVGLYPIPERFGMTLGELAMMINEEGWLKNGIKAKLTVVPLQNWQRNFWYDQTGLQFIKTSPNIPDLASATPYPGVCLLEGTNVSEGRGTETPFRIFGAPWIESKQLTTKLNSLHLSGVTFADTTFTPVSIPGASTNPKYKNRTCSGAVLIIKNRDAFQPFKTGLNIVNSIARLYPDSLTWRNSHFDRLCGTDKIRRTIQTSGNIDSLITTWEPQLATFLEKRKKYLLY